MNVLSLFDGISGGQQTFKELGVLFDGVKNTYYASEIEKYPMQVTQYNFPNTIQLGDIRFLNPSTLSNIDIVIGGSPCKNLSSSGKLEGMITEDKIELLSLEQYLDLKEKGFKFKGQSYLFWEYIRILREVKPKYFLLENVVMSDKWKDIFTKELGIEPILINSELVSAQMRKRLYWTNIPNITQPSPVKADLLDIIDDTAYEFPGAVRGRYLNKASIIGRRLNDKGCREDYNKDVKITQCLEVRATNRNKSNCLTTVAKDTVLTNMPVGRHPNAYERKLPFRYYTIKECARLQGFPDDYCNCISDAQARKAYGNGWNVPTIKHIFKNLIN